MKILIYPLGSNPYQDLLIKQLKKTFAVSIASFNNRYIDKHGFILGIISFPFRLTYFRLRGYRIFHLHWISPFIIHHKNTYLHKLSIIYVFGFVILLKILDYKIVWTIHNLKSHERKFIYYDFAIKFLSRITDAKIVHSKENIKDMKKMKYDIRNTYVIPIGNYIDIYKNSLTKNQAKDILNIKRDSYVILCFGRVEPYKGIEDLIEEFKNINLLKSTLLIVGPCSDKLYKNKLLKYKKDNIIFELTHVVDENVQIYFNASDVVACPYKYITTSSSAILALSFGRPVIAPLIGNLTDVPKNAGFFYNLKDKSGLRNSILKSISHKDQLFKMNNNSYSYAKTLSWDIIASQTYDVYKKFSK